MQNAKFGYPQSGCKIQNLRKKYPRFIYERYFWKILGGDLNISFVFKIEPDIEFNPKIIIKNIDKNRTKGLGNRILDNLIFNLGLIELLSYWKATSAPEIEIKAGPLNEEQIRWWKDLIMKGMGQFFYENKIDFRQPNFLKIVPIVSSKTSVTRNVLVTLKNRVLVPIGGGKDSVVTLEILSSFAKASKDKEKINCFSLNPTEAADEIMKIAGFKNPIIVKRKIDPKLLKLNQEGFLNGHTPFSAYLAFLSVLCAVLFDYKFIAFSNERSSNEGNLKYLGKIINHQWSKSFEFEQKFRKYCRKYLTPGVKEDKSSFPPSLPLRGSSVVEYFSFLRPLYEIQIAKLFSKYPKYFNAFLSCNVAYQTTSGAKKPTKKWCGKCPKCLFIFASLYPFVETEKLIKIFRKNLFEGKKLLPIMQQLVGKRGFKPFECVGTKKESQIAFYLSYKKYKEHHQKLPFLLRYFENKILNSLPCRTSSISERFLRGWNNQHNLPKYFERILKYGIERFKK